MSNTHRAYNFLMSGNESREGKKSLKEQAAAANAIARELVDDPAMTYDRFFDELNKRDTAPDCGFKNFSNLASKIFRPDGFTIRTAFNIKEIADKKRTGLSALMNGIDQRGGLAIGAKDLMDERTKLHKGIHDMFAAANDHETDWKLFLKAALAEVAMREAIMKTEVAGEPPIVGNKDYLESGKRADSEGKERLFACARILLKEGFHFVEDLYQ